MTKGLVLAGTAILIAAGSYGPAAAQFKPTKQIEVVVHSGPGAGNDVFGRAVIATIEKEKLVPVHMQVSNRTGGGSTRAQNYMVSKAGDTHTIAVFTSLWVTNPLVQKAAKHKMVTDMTPIARLVLEPGVIVVRADSPYKTLKDLMEAARKNPGKLKQSGGSIMGRDNLVRQVLQAAAKVQWTFISFPGGGERIAQLLGGHVDLMVMEPSEAGELIRSGKLRALAQLSTKRVPGYEKVPTLKEAGYDVPEVPQARGFVAPPKIPAAALAYYEDLFLRMSKTPTWQKLLHDDLLEGAYLNSKDTIAFLKGYENTMRGILKLAGIKTVR
jgi:putative tricarboxylic transport membrane protein